MASMTGDKAQFLPKVLQLKSFQKTGILFGSDASLGSVTARFHTGKIHWVVIDPRKHIMFTWEKDRDNFVEAAKTLGASAFSNGSFNLYMSGNGLNAHGLDAVLGFAEWGGRGAATAKMTIANFASLLAPDSRNSWVKSAKADMALVKVIEGMRRTNYKSLTPEGHVLGSKIKNMTSQPRPNAAYFERRGGRDYAHYDIGQGDPKTTGKAEAIGGLFQVIKGGANVQDPSLEQVNGCGIWGLAPVALAALKASDPAFAEISAPYEATPGTPALTGVIVGLFGWESFNAMINTLVGIGTDKAVRIDSSDSILFGHHKTVIIGGPNDMPEHKQLYNRWGYQFQAG